MKQILKIIALIGTGFLLMGLSIPGCSTYRDGGVFRSGDFGENFEQKSLLSSGKTFASREVVELVMDPQDPNIIYAGTLDKGIYKTIDSGESWVNILENVAVTGIAIDPENTNKIYVVAYVGENARLYTNENAGDGEWGEELVHTEEGTSLIDVVVDWYDSSVIYVISQDGGVFQSKDAGFTWRNLVWLEDNLNFMQMSPEDTRHLYIASNDDLWRSVDGGETWTSLKENISTAVTSYGDLNDLSIDDTVPSTIYVATDKALVRSYNYGDTWEVINTLVDYGTVDYLSVAVDPNNSSRIYFGAGSAVHTSADGGETWLTRLLSTSRGATSLIVDYKSPSTVYVGLTKITNAGL